MQCTIEAIDNAVRNLRNITAQLSSSFCSEWDDEVKESYRSRYLSDCRNALEKIEEIKNQLQSECDQISKVNTDSIISSAESLCAAIRSV